MEDGEDSWLLRLMDGVFVWWRELTQSERERFGLLHVLCSHGDPDGARENCEDEGEQSGTESAAKGSQARQRAGRAQVRERFRCERRERRLRCVALIDHWIDNIRRDVGVSAPYVFVILSVVSVSAAELEWACVNSVRNKRLGLFGEKGMQMATGNDDSFPRLLQRFLTLRMLLLDSVAVIAEFASACAQRVLQSVEVAAETVSALSRTERMDDWMPAALQAADPVPQSLWEATMFLLLGKKPLEMMYRRSEVPHLAGFYGMMYTFCDTNYTRKGDFGFQFNFVDLADMLRHSRQTLSRDTEVLFAHQAQTALTTLQTRVADNMMTLLENEEKLLRGEACAAMEEVDQEDLEECAQLLRRYRVMQLANTTVSCEMSSCVM